MANQELIENLSHQSTWRLFGLAIITLGVYPAYYIDRQTSVINSAIDVNARIPSGLVDMIFVLTWISLVSLVTILAGAMNPTFEVIANLIDLALAILVIIWSFKARNRVSEHCDLSVHSGRWFNAAWTFLFTSLYFNYKVNSLYEQGVFNRIEASRTF